MALRDPFEVFCLYYLGLTPQGEYRFVNANQIAKQYNCSVADLLAFLKTHELHPDRVLNTDFPMARYQVDVQMTAENVGPEQALEFAERIFNHFQASAGNRRDWAAEIEREKEEERERRYS